MALSVFDKQIAPILRYGSPIWSSPQSTNKVVFHGIENDSNAHDTIRKYCLYICKENVDLSSIIKMGKSRESPKPYMVTLENIEYKIKLLCNTNIMGNDTLYDMNIDQLEYKKISQSLL